MNTEPQTPEPWDARIAWYRSRIDKETLRELTQRSDLGGWIQAGGHLLLVILTGSFAYYSWHHLPWYVTLGAIYIHGIGFAFLSPAAAVHELSHGTVFRTRFLNELFIRIFSFLSRSNFHHFRASHGKHHQLTVHTGRDLEVILPAKIRKRDWLYALTFSPKALYYSFKGLIKMSCGRLDGEWNRRIFPARDGTKRRQVVRWARFMLFGHLLLAALFVGTSQWALLVLVTLAPHYGGILAMLCSATQHVGLPPNVPDFRLCCRSVILGPLPRFLYWRMNYHIEHHMFAAVPCYNLPRLRKTIEADLPRADKGLAEAWRNILTILRKQREDPTYAYHAELPAD